MFKKNINKNSKLKDYIDYWLENIAKPNFSKVTYDKNLNIINSKIIPYMR